MDVERCYLSTITIFEIEKGILSKEYNDPQQGQILRNWFEQQIKPELFTPSNRILAIDPEISITTTKMHIPNPASLADSFIGATALQHHFTLVTRNSKDFEHFGIKLFNPFI